MAKKKDKEFEIKGFFKPSGAWRTQRVVSVSESGARQQINKFYKGDFKITKVIKKRTFDI